MLMSPCPELPGYAGRLTHEVPSNVVTFDLLWMMLCIEAIKDCAKLMTPLRFAETIDAIARLARYDWNADAEKLARSKDAQVLTRDIRAIYVQDKFFEDMAEPAAVRLDFNTVNGPDELVTWWSPMMLPSYYRRVLVEAACVSGASKTLADWCLENLSKTK